MIRRGAFLLFVWLIAAGADGRAAPPELRGIVAMGAQSMASLALGNGGERWCAEGTAFGDYVVKKIDPSAGFVLLQTKDGGIQKVFLASAHIKPLPVVQLDPNWINSDRNPMYLKPADLPNGVMDRWFTKMSEAERQKWILWYLQHGWILTAREGDHGDSSFAFQNLYQEARNQKLWLKVDQFQATLSSDQQAQFTAMDGKTLVWFGTFAEPSVVALRVNQQQEQLSKFLNNLTPEQKQAYRKLFPGLAAATKPPPPNGGSPAANPPASPPPSSPNPPP